MQSLVLPPSLSTAQFGHSRFNSGPERLPLSRPWPTNARGCSPDASLSCQSMSGSAPPDGPSVTSAEKPPVYKPAASPRALTAEEAAPESTRQQPAVSEPPPAASPPGSGEQPATTRPPGTPIFPLSTGANSAARTTARHLVQRSTRRTKAHVASACVNCKKKHLGCDPARPCRRCVLAGKAASCVDVTHKKRGRPPLKAEESSMRSYTTHAEKPTVPAETQPGAARRTAMHRTTSSRELRPVTDLQPLDDAGSPAAGMSMARSQPQRWSASVFPLTRPVDPAPSGLGSARRPFSSSGPPSYSAPSYPPPAFAPLPSGFNPVFKTGSLPSAMERRFSAHFGPSLPPPTSPPQHQSPLGVPLLPSSDPSSSAMRHPAGDSRFPSASREPFFDSPVRLPPIHQATAGAGAPHHTHRLSDPYPATWYYPSREEDTHQPWIPSPLQRPMEPGFLHNFTHQRSSSTAGLFDPTPRHLGPIDLPSPIPAPGSSSIGTRIEQAGSEGEAEREEPRPMKRRKMALDDMVNG